jgi:hypothetical protein
MTNKIGLAKSGLTLNKSSLKVGGTSIGSNLKKKHPFDDIEYTGDDAVDAAQEFNEVQKAFMDRNKAEQERFQLATDSEYWCCLVFQSREQKEAFLHAVNWMTHGDKYIDGVKAARTLGVEIPTVKVPYNTSEGKSVTKNLRDLTE